jgi:Lon protease-like protein
MLPPSLPIFPLPNAVLFPSVFLPLHIFEARYREMVAAALAGERMIGMTLLKPGWETSGEGNPPVFDVGCAGLISHADRLPDGRYNIVLRGLQRFRITAEDSSRPYRVAEVHALDDHDGPRFAPALAEARAKLESVLLPALGTESARFPIAMGDADLINALSQYLDLEPIERQALLESQGVVERAAALIELVEMKLMTPGRTPSPGQVH